MDSEDVATTWMDLEGIMLNEISQRKTNIIRFHLYVESKRSEQQKKQKLIYRYLEQIDDCQRGGWRDVFYQQSRLKSTNLQI